MNDLLDDEFGAYKPYREALSAEDLKTLEGKIPYSILRGDVLADVCVLFDEAGIDYALQPQQASTNGTGIIPLASTQLNMVDTLVYIKGASKAEADVLVANYEAKVAATTEEKDPTSLKTLYWWSFGFILVVIVYAYFR
ncbi:MAG: hypothetical protein ACRBFS_12260 [Aureispira sp.]